MDQAQVIGLGRSGIAAARLLQQQGQQVTLYDSNNSATLKKQKQQLEQQGIQVKLGENPSLEVDNLPQLIAVSPGVPWNLPILREARSLGVETVGEIELAWRYLQDVPWVGITGTNGKTTTTALIAAIFQSARFHAPACGNIGYAACELAIAENAQSIDWVIAELSSYQIESSSQLTPRIGVWTTFTADHLARHHTLDNYYQIKASLLRRCPQQVFNGDDPYLRKVGVAQWENAYWTSVTGKAGLLVAPQRGIFLEDGWVIAFNEAILPARALKMVGSHNLQNLLLAVGVARLAGIEKDAIMEAIANFPGVPHRLEHICSYCGADFINDSKATNYDAAQVGLASVASPVLLIAGGKAKAGDDSLWLETIGKKAAQVLLIGEAAPQFAQRLHDCGYENYLVVETMEEAVGKAAQIVQQQDIRVVLLSPACASFDQYQSFEHRGEHFRQLCQTLGD